jgi:precorrin-4/cobalt-precorrin-4 C11-methyltransferase
MPGFSFVDAGPGNPELLTLRASRLISEADTILTSGTETNREILKGAKQGARIQDTSKMPLEDIMKRLTPDLMEEKKVVYVYSDDPAMSGTIFQLMVELERYQLPYEMVPGVSAWSAAAASLNQRLTLPYLSETVIVTRRDQETVLRQKDSLAALAKHNTTMVIFLNLETVRDVVGELTGPYRGDTPAVIIHDLTCQAQKILRLKLSEIADAVEKEEGTGRALLIVGDVLDPVLRTIDMSNPFRVSDENS